MADVNRGSRPLSPHLTIYRRHQSMMMSIAHRITGCGMALGAVLGVWWFLGAAGDADDFDLVDGLLTSWIGGLVMILVMFAFWYHFFSGLRHLTWDAGLGLELDAIEKTSLVVLGGAAVMSLITLIVALI